MGENHNQTNQNITACHDGNDNRGDETDTVYAAEDNQTGQCCHDNTNDHRPHAVVKVRDIELDRGCNVVSLKAVKAVSKAGNQ